MRALVHGAVALIFAYYARGALRRGWRFLWDGLGAIRAVVEAPDAADYRRDLEARRRISEAGAFVIGGALWLLFGAFAVGVAVTLAWLALAELG